MQRLEVSGAVRLIYGSLDVKGLSLNLLTTQTMVTTGIFPCKGKIPMLEPGIEPGTS